MAYIQTDEEQKLQQANVVDPFNQQQTGQAQPAGNRFDYNASLTSPATTGESAVLEAGGSSGTPSQAPQKAKAPGQFATLSKYLQANKQYAPGMATKIAQPIESQFQQGASQAQSSVDKAKTDIQNWQKNIIPTNKLGTADLAKYSDKQLSNALKGYTGPQEVDVTGAQDLYNKALERSTTLGKEGGLSAALADLSRNKRKGLSAFDSALFNQSPEAQASLERLTSGLPGQYEKQMGDIQGVGSKAISDAKKQGYNVDKAVSDAMGKSVKDYAGDYAYYSNPKYAQNKTLSDLMSGTLRNDKSGAHAVGTWGLDKTGNYTYTHPQIRDSQEAMDYYKSIGYNPNNVHPWERDLQTFFNTYGKNIENQNKEKGSQGAKNADAKRKAYEKLLASGGGY